MASHQVLPSPADPARAVITDLIDGAQDAWFKLPPRAGVPSAWYGHVPFAFWLVRSLRPSVLVELGTREGVAYAALCQAVLDAGLATSCYGVVSMRTDPSEEADFRAFHDARYGAFSRLLRTPSDDAASHFAEGSVDLLHIHNALAGDAARRQFERWRPRLSPRAVVLLSASNVREGDAGVWRLWSALSGAYPSFEFLHGEGLGVLAVGPEVDGAVRALCALRDPTEIATLRRRFAQSGGTGAVASAERPPDLGWREAERLDLIAVAQEIRAADIRQRLAIAERDLAETRAKLAQANDDLVHAGLQIAHFREFAEAYHRLIGSTLWRSLQPLRNTLSRIPPPLRRAMRLSGQAAWWGVTPWRISARLAERRERIARANAPPPAPVLPPPAPPPPFDRFALDRIDTPREGYVPLIRWFDPIAPEVSIVVPNWNGGDMTLLCLQHLWQHTTGHHYEIIVVDNGSDPAEVARLREQAPFARVIALGANRYFGEASNIGVEAARGRCVCLLNNDAFVPPGWLEPLMRAFEAEPGVGVVGPRLIDPDGCLQEAGALIDADGTVAPLGAGAAVDDPAFGARRIVDYVSAACLLVRRDDFLRVLGFDLCWDPAYYEDVDLCLKLRMLGLKSVYTPDTAIVHFKDATGARQGKALRLDNIVAINRTKFLARWGRYLDTDGLERPDLLPGGPIGTLAAEPRTPRMRVLIYTPYQLTPGGGERYVLTMAEAFKDIAHIALVTPVPVSRVRLLTMAREFELDLDQVELLSPADVAAQEQADLAFVLGNEIFPTVGRMARRNLYICQFPFPFPAAGDGERRKPFWHEFDGVIVYSEFVRAHVIREAARWNVPSRPVEILAPPVPMVVRTATKRRGKILHVGRFIADGHCKRQDRLIDALRLLRDQGVTAELHLAGSTMPEAQHRAYYTGLIEQADGLPVYFHANCSTAALHVLYAESDIYWHATGVGADIEAAPHVAEHFGISVVEAMSAGCIPIVFDAGGPATIVEDSVTGYHFRTIEELAAKTRHVLEELPEAAANGLRGAAQAASRQFDEPTFRERVRSIADRAVHAANVTATP